jgi:transcriptional regulator with GAF, ATPase, and Fis domain
MHSTMAPLFSEALLDLVPTAICRWDLVPPLPTSTPAELVGDALRERGRIGYLNPAQADLLGAPAPADLLGVRLAAAPSLFAGQEHDLARRFAREGFRLRAVALRLPGRDRSPRSYQTSWLGVIEGESLVAVWVVLHDLAPAAGQEPQPDAVEDGEGFVGESDAVRRVLEKVAQVAATDATVLIRGETGTGKELIARAIHRASARRLKPLVAVNCGAIASGLVESELFGHEKGAFTGALARRLGQFELAQGGTLFLDEIGDLSPALQVKLLRVLQEGELVRVGGTQPVKVDVRVIAATHRDLPAMVQAGEFRQDLYYRLNVFPILIPPLRDRPEDLPLLVRHLAARYATRLGKRIDTIPEAVLARLAAYAWPGNVRELANLLERSVIVTRGSVLELAEWATGVHAPVAPAAPASPRALLEVEREHILQTLERTRWKVSGPGGAAEALGLKPTTLEARMKKLGIERPTL